MVGSSERRPLGSPPGVTLLEILITLSLIAIVSAVSAPALLDRNPTGDPPGSLRALIRDARAHATANARLTRLTIDVPSARYWIRASVATRDTLLDTGIITFESDFHRGAKQRRMELTITPTGQVLGEHAGALSASMIQSARTDARE